MAPFGRCIILRSKSIPIRKPADKTHADNLRDPHLTQCSVMQVVWLLRRASALRDHRLAFRRGSVQHQHKIQRHTAAHSGIRYAIHAQKETAAFCCFVFVGGLGVFSLQLLWTHQGKDLPSILGTRKPKIYRRLHTLLVHAGA